MVMIFMLFLNRKGARFDATHFGGSSYWVISSAKMVRLDNDALNVYSNIYCNLF